MHPKTTFLAVAVLALGIAAAALAQDGELSVAEMVLGTAFAQGTVTSPSTTFTRGAAPIYCQVRLENPSRQAGKVRIAFERAEGTPADRPQAGIALDYPARARYRTVARTTSNRAAGRWRCVARTDEGRVLSHADFEVTE